MIRFFDIFFSVCGLLLCLPLFIIISACIALDSRGPVFYTQLRVGKGNKDFRLMKFRSMRKDTDVKGGLTIGSRDSRITRFGYYLRRLKLDELPQLINVLMGEMSLVGPRPEIRKYVDQYTSEQKKGTGNKAGNHRLRIPGIYQRKRDPGQIIPSRTEVHHRAYAGQDRTELEVHQRPQPLKLLQDSLAYAKKDRLIPGIFTSLPYEH